MTMHVAPRNDPYSMACTGALKAQGARLTAARKAVIEVLAHSLRPVTVREVMDRLRGLKRQANGVDVVSVYRTLDKLSELGLVHQVAPAGSYLPCRHATCAHSAHVLLHCTRCGRIEETELPDAVVSPLNWYLAEKKRFHFKQHIFQVDGHCEHCRE